MSVKAQIAAVTLVAAMFVVAGIAHSQEIVFPEIAALALGAWVMKEPPWRPTVVSLWISPTLAALTGVCIVRFIREPFPLQIGVAFLVVALQLKLMKSAILPAISAAMLPIVTRTTNWSYPFSVCVLTLVVALGRAALGRTSAGGSDAGAAPKFRTAQELLHWSKLLAGVLIVSAIAWRSRWFFMVAPPLTVAFVELSKPDGPGRAKARLIFLLLVLAACSGVFWIYVLQRVMHAPMWSAALLSLGTILLAFQVVRLPFPPAAAIALLPAIIPAGNLVSYPFQVSLGSAAFWLLSAGAFGRSPRGIS
ncbi:MAG TPA: hypothetical protein VMK12_03565 [Anaeromyxobacteraceae bacterium]|nr:hypothetical protein [Anaeromyxobacteraceae bacterium]